VQGYGRVRMHKSRGNRSVVWWAQGTPTHLPAEVLVKRKKRLRGGGETWEVVRARGHLDEVQELRASVPPGESGLVLALYHMFQKVLSCVDQGALRRNVGQSRLVVAQGRSSQHRWS
jgi:hypothetical protein